MNHIFRITLLSCLVITGLSFAMDVLQETQLQPLELSLISKIHSGQFLNDHEVILRGSGSNFTGLVLYNIETKKEEKSFEATSAGLSIGAVSGDLIASYNGFCCSLLNLKTNKAYQADHCVAMDRSFGFSRTGKLFLYNTGGRINLYNPTSGESGSGNHVGDELIAFNPHTGKRHVHKLECTRDKDLAGAMASHPTIEDEIAYTSDMNRVSIMSIQDKHVEKKSVITVDDIVGYVSGPLRYNHDGSYLAIGVRKAIHNSDLISFHIYDFEKKQLIDCNRAAQDAIFYPNSSILALLQGDCIVSFLDFKTQEIIAVTNKFHSPILGADRRLSMALSPDGKNLFVQITILASGQAEHRAFLIPVPAVVYAYNKAQQEQK